MNKRYFPFIALIAAALLLFWVKKNQRGTSRYKPTTQVNKTAAEPIDRNITTLIYSEHAKCRMGCRNIDESEVKEILLKGEINYDRVEESSNGSYPLEGITHDKQHVRIVFAPHDDKLVVVTVIDLEKEWECDCR